AADGAHDRNRTVLETKHLVEATGLVKRRHQKESGARLDLMGEGFIEGDAHAHTVGIPRYGGAKELFEAGSAVAELAGLDMALYQQVEDGFNQIEPLLRGQARDH